jgi:hypothetical protein
MKTADYYIDWPWSAVLHVASHLIHPSAHATPRTRAAARTAGAARLVLVGHVGRRAHGRGRRLLGRLRLRLALQQ